MDELKNKTGIAMKQTIQRITGALGLVFVTYAMLGSSPVKAESPYTPVLEFNELSRDEQFPIVRSALSKIYEHYSVREPNKAVADCIIDLFNNPDREINGYDHFGIALQVALTNPDVELISVEKILLGIVHSECEVTSD